MKDYNYNTEELNLNELKDTNGGWIRIALEIGAAAISAGVYLYDNWECITEAYEENRN